MRLVTNKTAWVRTYLRSGQDSSFDGGQVLDVNGMLTVERRVGGVWNIVASIPSQNGSVNAQADFVSYDAERGNIDTSLNFVVPASIVTGLLRFTVDVASPFAHCPGNTASGQTQVDVNLTQTLNAAFITIGYNGPDNANTTTLNLPAPTLAQCQTETSWAMTTYPLSGTPNVRLAGTFVTATPLNDPRSCPGCCSPNWQPLLQQVAALVALDQAGNPGTWAYYGIVNAGIPVNVPGCNGWGATGGLAGQPVTSRPRNRPSIRPAPRSVRQRRQRKRGVPGLRAVPDLQVILPTPRIGRWRALAGTAWTSTTATSRTPTTQRTSCRTAVRGGFPCTRTPTWSTPLASHHRSSRPAAAPRRRVSYATNRRRSSERNEATVQPLRLSAWHHRRGRQCRGRDGGEAADPISSWTWATDPLYRAAARRKRQGPVRGHRVRLPIGRLPLRALRRLLLRGEKSAADLVQDDA